MDQSLVYNQSDKKMQFANKVVLVTGASSGIGAATAILFAKLGASLSLTGRNLDRLNQVSAKCMKYEHIPNPLILKAELTNDNEVEGVVANTVRHFGRLGMLFYRDICDIDFDFDCLADPERLDSRRVLLFENQTYFLKFSWFARHEYA